MQFKEGEFLDEQQDAQLPANTKSIASDIAQASDSRDTLGNAPLGSPLAEFDVRSVYDARPVNSYDFNIVISNQDTCSGVGIWTGGQFDFGFIVPSGYVAVLKKLHHSFSPPPVITARKDVTAALLVNGSLYQRGVQIVAVGADPTANASPGDIPIGLESDDILQSFVIADENQSLGVRIKVSAAIAAIGPVFYAHLYGQLLLKTGRPAQFEPANRIGKASAGSPIYRPATQAQVNAEAAARTAPPPPPEPPREASQSMTSAPMLMVKREFRGKHVQGGGRVTGHMRPGGKRGNR